MPIRSSILFPNTSARAAYSPREIIVHIEEEFDPARADEAYRRDWFEAHLPVLVHEFQHGLDHVGTVAGRELLTCLSDAHFGLESKLAGDSSQLWRLAALRDAERRFDRGAYFHEYDPDYRWLTPRLPRWRWESSVGLAFDHAGRSDAAEPIYFLRFTDVDQNRFVSRQPITAAALFETRAMFVELEHAALIAFREAQGDEERLSAFGRDQARTFYDPSLTLYSAPAHLAASRCGDGDPLTAYRIAAHAAGVVLNLAPDLDLDVRIPDVLRDERGMERLQQLVARRDPGFLFVVLISAAPRYDGDTDCWLRDALAAANFPPLDAIYEAALGHLAYPSVRHGTQFDMIYFEGCAAGHTNAARTRPTRGLLDVPTMSRLNTVEGPFALPNYFAGDRALAPPCASILEADRQREAVEGAAVLSSQMAEFLAACR
ncbi:hypothetical protein JW805_03215 [Roseomonas aeriglobus]|nr:hypothetical protein [Roseomonas aeriglobus]